MREKLMIYREVSASLMAMSSVAIGWQSLRLRKRLMTGG
jgi:hypothetical protein